MAQCTFLGDGVARLSCAGCRTMIASLLAGRLPSININSIQVIKE